MNYVDKNNPFFLSYFDKEGPKPFPLFAFKQGEWRGFLFMSAAITGAPTHIGFLAAPNHRGR